jgi:hypothetical protein
MTTDLPTGTVTMLFTDNEGSTKLQHRDSRDWLLCDFGDG